MELGLGTVQFGVDYGVSNTMGQTPRAEVARILEFAAAQGIRILDTAPAYGCSEQVLGDAGAGEHFSVVTKTRRVRKPIISRADAEGVYSGLATSLQHLHCSSVYGWIVHQVDDLLVEGGEHVYATQIRARECGLVRKIGVSVYDARELDAILDRYDIDLVQIPLNVFDQRLLRSGHLASLKGRGIEVHIRSAFLQGLLMMPPECVPDYFFPIRHHLRRYHEFVAGNGWSLLQAALAFLNGVPEADVVICGINDRAQLNEICSATVPSGDPCHWAEFALDDPDFVNPSRWKVPTNATEAAAGQ